MTRGQTIAAAACGLAMLAAADPAPATDMDAAADDAWGRDRLTGDWGGVRGALSAAGFDIAIDYVGETMANVSGGVKTGSIYDGKLELALDIDLEALAGWSGATVHASMLQIHGHGPSPMVGGNLLGVSNIEAARTTRLNTLWLEQGLLDDRLSIRGGQLAADDEFFASDTAGYLINGTFGWGAIAAANMTSGGPAYPLPTPGVRVAAMPAPAITVLAAAFSGDPAGDDCTEDDPQLCNDHGTTFSLSGGTLWMGELQFAANAGDGAAGLPGVYKLGGWYETGDFDDQHYSINAAGALVSLADASAGDPVSRRGNFGIYAIADQMVWRETGSETQGLSLFGRIGGTQADRNLVSLYVDGGFGYTGPIPTRDDDVLALGVAYAEIGSDAADLDRDLRAGDPTVPVRDHEIAVELTYIAQLAPWWTVQADAQYIAHPGGNVADPNDPSRTIEDAAVLGLRTTIAF